MKLTVEQIDVLATYNAECYRGIVHTPEYDARMADLQARFEGKLRSTPRKGETTVFGLPAETVLDLIYEAKRAGRLT